MPPPYTYTEAIALTEHDSGKFDPKPKQKAIYKWYDSRYSDEALDIYSEEWQQRITQWHSEAVATAEDCLKTKESLGNLEFGTFFLSHPIAAFSLWNVLQASYELDRAVCGTTMRDFQEIKSWQSLSPFKYLRDERVQLKWQASLEDLKDRIKNQDVDIIDTKEEPWELRMYDILLGVERFEDSFAILKENFSVNLAGMDFSSWMIERIDEDIGKRFSMITDLLEFKEHELDGLRPAETTENNLPVTSAPQYDIAPPPPKYKRTWTRRSQSQNLTIDTSRSPPKSRFGFKSGLKTIKVKFQKPRDYVKSLSNR